MYDLMLYRPPLINEIASVLRLYVDLFSIIFIISTSGLVLLMVMICKLALRFVFVLVIVYFRPKNYSGGAYCNR